MNTITQPCAEYVDAWLKIKTEMSGWPANCATEEDKRTIVPNNRTNVFVAAFTTCWARLKLYSYLERLGDQVMYYDTDSVIYRWKEGQNKLETGDFLGDMTDELDGDTIEEFVSGGPKN